MLVGKGTATLKGKLPSTPSVAGSLSLLTAYHSLCSWFPVIAGTKIQNSHANLCNRLSLQVGNASRLGGREKREGLILC